MRRLALIVSLLSVSLLLATVASAEDEPRFAFGLESRLGEPFETLDSGAAWGLIPNFSYHLDQRFRIDAFAGLSWTDSGDFGLSLQPGFRYYLSPPRGPWRFNTGLSVGFRVIDGSPEASEDGRLDQLKLETPTPAEEGSDSTWVRLVPLAAEYWGHERWGLTLALDYQTRLHEVGHEEDGFGVAAGFRFRIR